MPVSIPTYFATQFVRNSPLNKRMDLLKTSYTYQYCITISSLCIMNMNMNTNMNMNMNIPKEIVFFCIN